MQATGKVLAHKKDVKTIKGNVVYGVCLDIGTGKDQWFDFWEKRPDVGAQVSFSYTQDNPKFNGNVNEFELIEAGAPAQATVVPMDTHAAASSYAAPSRDLSIVRQNSMRHATAAAITAGLFYSGMSRGEFQAALCNLVKDAEIITAYSTVNDAQVEAFVAEYTK